MNVCWQLCIAVFAVGSQSVGVLGRGLSWRDSVLRPQIGGRRGNAGFKLRISPRGLDYVNEISEKLLTEAIRSKTIDDYSTKFKKGEASFKNIKISEFVAPKLHYSVPVEGGNQISWSASGGKVSISGDFKAKKKIFWVKLKAKGSLRITASDVSISVGSAIKSDPKLENPQCSVRIGSLKLKLKGGIVTKLLNLVRGLLSKFIKPKIEKVVCKAVEKYMEKDVNNKLKTFPTDSSMGRLPFKVMYSLTSDPRMTSSGGITTSHKGEIRSLRSPSDQLTYYPHDMQIEPGNSKMLYAYASDYVVNSFLSHARKNHFADHTFTDADVPFLRMSCPGAACMGSVFREMSQKYPNAKGSARLSATSDPTVCFNPGNITVSAVASMVVSANEGGGSQQVLSTNLWVSAGLSPRFSDTFDKMFGSVKIYTLEFTDFTTSFSNMTATEIRASMNKLLQVVQRVAEQMGNHYLVKGIEIPIQHGPIIKGIQLNNVALRLLKRTVELSFDVKYLGRIRG